MSGELVGKSAHERWPLGPSDLNDIARILRRAHLVAVGSAAYHVDGVPVERIEWLVERVERQRDALDLELRGLGASQRTEDPNG